MSDNCEERLERICDYQRLDAHLGTAGQPTRDQFRDINNAGFEVVINLAMADSDNAIEDEGSVVAALGMSYVHIPVDFESPKLGDYELFRGVMDACHEKLVFVHCAANKRVSAFLYLYRTGNGMSHETAWNQMENIWTPDSTWQKLIADARQTSDPS